MSDYSSNFPTQSPTFAFDAKAGKLDSRLSYSRSSGGTYLSNEKALSSENLITQSQFSGWAELTSPTVTAAYTNGPDGSSNTATRLQSASGANRFFYSTATSWTSGQQYTVSCWVKSNTGVAQTFAFFLPTTAYASADLTTHASDWTRITATFTAATSSSYCGFKLLSANTTDLSIWGFQVNSGANALDYQATSGSIHREFAPTLKTSAADTPRFEFASDGQSEGLLIEAQATNLQRYGSAFSSWSASNNVSVSSNSAVGPNGNLEATLVVATSTLGDHYVFDNGATLASGTDYTASVYVKDAGQRYVQLVGSSGNFGGSKWATFDLVDGSIDATNVTASAESVGNGWWRIQATMAATGSTQGNIFVTLANSATAARSNSFTGDDYSGVLLFGYQLETGSSASSLVDSGTSSSGVTRAADSCSVALSQINYSGGEVTLVSETASVADDFRQAASLITDSSNQVTLYGNSSGSRLGAVIGGGQTSILTQTAADGISALSFGVNDIAATRNGAAPTTDTSQSFPELTGGTLKIGGSGTNQPLDGHIKRLALYNVALSDTELQAITS